MRRFRMRNIKAQFILNIEKIIFFKIRSKCITFVGIDHIYKYIYIYYIVYNIIYIMYNISYIIYIKYIIYNIYNIHIIYNINIYMSITVLGMYKMHSHVCILISHVQPRESIPCDCCVQSMQACKHVYSYLDIESIPCDCCVQSMQACMHVVI